jgi:hypothetical protein
VADSEPPRPAQVARDLLGAPLPAQQLIYEREVGGGEAAVAARAGAAAVRALLGGEGSVMPIGLRAVAPDLAADGRAVAAERACDLCLAGRIINCEFPNVLSITYSNYRTIKAESAES